MGYRSSTTSRRAGSATRREQEASMGVVLVQAASNFWSLHGSLQNGQDRFSFTFFALDARFWKYLVTIVQRTVLQNTCFDHIQQWSSTWTGMRAVFQLDLLSRTTYRFQSKPKQEGESIRWRIDPTIRWSFQEREKERLGRPSRAIFQHV